jgi:hypothetical protein
MFITLCTRAMKMTIIIKSAIVNHPLSNCCEKQVQPRHEYNRENACEQITAVKRSKQTKFHHRNFIPVLMDYEKSHQTILTGHKKREGHHEYPSLRLHPTELHYAGVPLPCVKLATHLTKFSAERSCIFSAP